MFSRYKLVLAREAARLQGKLEQYRSLRLVKNTLKGFSADEAMDRAGSVAYYVMLSIFPLLIGVISILGFVLPMGTVRQTVYDFLDQTFPASVNLIQGNLDNVIRLRGTGGVISILMLMWSGSNLFAVIGRAVNRAWNIRKDRPFVKRKLRDLLLVLAAGVLILFSFAASLVYDLTSGVDNVVVDWLLSFGSYFLSFLLAFFVFLMVYRFMPNRKIYWRAAWPGAVLGAAIFELGKHGFIFYLSNFASYNMVYGSLASVIILMFWIYISAIILILGVEFNSQLFKIQQEEKASIHH